MLYRSDFMRRKALYDVASLVCFLIGLAGGFIAVTGGRPHHGVPSPTAYLIFIVPIIVVGPYLVQYAFQLICPHCRWPLLSKSKTSSVVTTGRCASCGRQVFVDDEQEGDEEE